MKFNVFATNPLSLTLDITPDEIGETVPAAELSEMKQILHNIMSAISDFTSKLAAFQDQQDAAIAAIGDEIKGLNDKITALQNSPGTITPEDQALLDAAQARAQAAAVKLTALESLTPPVAPPVPIPEPPTPPAA